MEVWHSARILSCRISPSEGVGEVSRRSRPAGAASRRGPSGEAGGSNG